jgi:hypothetical protein
MNEKPKTWLDSEIVELMTAEAKAYRHDQQLKQQPINYREMMECVLLALQQHGLIEDTP